MSIFEKVNIDLFNLNLNGNTLCLQVTSDTNFHFAKADAKVSYGKVIEIMASLQAAGVDDVGMITEPYIGSN